MPRLILNLDRCVRNDGIDCPYAGSERTSRTGYTHDYYCKLMPDPNSVHGYKTTSEYVEWDIDINPIPLCCPIMAVEDKVLKIFEK